MPAKLIPPCSCGQPKEKAFHLACITCWNLVPLSLQQKVYRLYKDARGSGKHIAAVQEAYRIIHSKRNPGP